MTLILSKVWESIFWYCQSGRSKVAPTAVRRAAMDSKASGVGLERSSSMMAMATFPANMPRERSAPTSMMLPSMCVLYLASASDCSSLPGAPTLSGGVRSLSNDAWHSSRRSFLKLSGLPFAPVSAKGFCMKCSCSRTQRSAYMSMKWCCVVAFSKTSWMSSSTCTAELIPQSRSCLKSPENFSTVSLFKIDFTARATCSSPVDVAAFRRCC
mmetsp:Transcript_61867/g.109903  ORF Transcript_61867/g.109903 Transcript_61867/m.109903 type:complete len:212 (+) Transcript_61867:736-1371(+)